MKTVFSIGELKKDAWGKLQDAEAELVPQHRIFEATGCGKGCQCLPSASCFYLPYSLFLLLIQCQTVYHGKQLVARIFLWQKKKVAGREAAAGEQSWSSLRTRETRGWGVVWPIPFPDIYCNAGLFISPIEMIENEEKRSSED